MVFNLQINVINMNVEFKNKEKRDKERNLILIKKGIENYSLSY